MNLKRIQEEIISYRKFLRSPAAEQNLYKWESQRIFQENWSLNRDDFAEMYDASLQNSLTRRLWKRESYAPKDMMLKFIKIQPDFVRHIFNDLYNEEKSVDGRIDRFVFYCEEMLREYKEANPLSIENSHFHDDNYQMVSLYLAFRYPENYTLYEFQRFRNLLEKLEVRNIPKVNDIERFFKVMRTLQKLLEKDEQVMERHQRRLDKKKHFMGKSLLLAHDFCHAVVRNS